MSTNEYLVEYQEAGCNPLGTHHLPPPKGGEGEYQRVPGYFFVDKTNPVSGCFLSTAKCATLPVSEFADWSTSYLVRIND
jgi:hypothetical protein